MLPADTIFQEAIAEASKANSLTVSGNTQICLFL